MADEQKYYFGDEWLRRLNAMWRAFNAGGGGGGRIRIGGQVPGDDRPVELVKVLSAASGGGKYNGSIWRMPASTSLSASGDLAEADLGNAGDDILIFNAAEAGKSTHDLTDGTPVSKVFVGVYLGRVSGKAVYAINGYDFGDCDDS